MVYIVDYVQRKGNMRVVPILKKFHRDFPVGSMVKIEVIKQPENEENNQN